MQNHHPAISFACGCIILIGAYVSDAHAASPTEVAILLARIRSDDDTVGNEAVSILLREREYAVRELLEIVRTERRRTTDSTRKKDRVLSNSYWRTVRLLTEMRSIEAIRILVDDIEQRPEFASGGEMELSRYPNARHLLDFREAVIPVVLKHLQRYRPQDVTDRTIELFALVLEDAYTFSEPPHRLNDLIEVVQLSHRRAEQKENCQRLLEVLEKLRRGERPNLGQRNVNRSMAGAQAGKGALAGIALLSTSIWSVCQDASAGNWTVSGEQIAPFPLPYQAAR